MNTTTKPLAEHRPRKLGIWRVVAAAAVLLTIAALSIYLLWPGLLLRAEFARQGLTAGVTKREVQIGDHRWSYFERSAEDTGAGAPEIVFVHGFTGSKENYLPMLAGLDSAARVLAPDLPGWGESTRQPEGDYGITAQSRRLLAFLDAKGIDRAELVGHSMGGHIVGVFAATYPERVASLTLIDSAGVRFKPNAFALRVLRGETPFNMATRAEFDTFMSELFLNPPWLPPRLKDVLIEKNVEGHAFHTRVLAAVGKGEAAFQLERSLARIRAPTLVLWCREDRILDVSSTEALARIRPVPTRIVFDGCGHMAMMEKPAEFASAIADFVGENARNAARRARGEHARQSELSSGIQPAPHPPSAPSPRARGEGTSRS